jgi:hypothetical protein
MKIIIYILITFGLIACVNPRVASDNRRFERQRAEYDLQKFDELIVSNSPTSNKTVIEKNDGQVIARVGWLIRNTSDQNVILDLNSIRLILNDDSITPTCLENGVSALSLTLAPQKKTVLTCEVKIAPTVKNQLLRKDTMGIFEIPFGSKNQKITSTLLFRIEDFEK